MPCTHHPQHPSLTLPQTTCVGRLVYAARSLPLFLALPSPLAWTPLQIPGCFQNISAYTALCFPWHFRPWLDQRVHVVFSLPTHLDKVLHFESQQRQRRRRLRLSATRLTKIYHSTACCRADPFRYYAVTLGCQPTAWRRSMIFQPRCMSACSYSQFWV